MTGTDYTGTYRTCGGDDITVNACRGTQAIGGITGQPIDSTEFGQVNLHLGGTVVQFDNRDDLDNALDLLRIARNVADSRNPDNDKPRINAEN